MPVVECKNIRKSYGDLVVLKGIDLAIEHGEIVSIVGNSGAGKTTLLQIMGTLDQPNDGSLLLNGQDVFGMKDKKRSKFRNDHIGFVFQFHQLLPEFTALENVCIPAFIKGIGRTEAEKKASRLFDLLGISDRSGHRPAELSGGEQQRVAVARALINDPTIVLADEPSGNLDSQNADSLHRLFVELRKELNQTFVVVTHNETLANLADRKLTIADGVVAS